MQRLLPRPALQSVMQLLEHTGQCANLAAFCESVLGSPATVLRSLSSTAQGDSIVWPPPPGSVQDTRLAEAVRREAAKITRAEASLERIDVRGTLRSRVRNLLRERGHARDLFIPLKRKDINALKVQEMQTLLGEKGAIQDKQEVAQALWEALKADVVERRRERLQPSSYVVESSPLSPALDEPLNDSLFFSVFENPDEVAQMLCEAKTDDVCILDVQKQCTFTNHMVVATGRSTEHVSMAANAIVFRVKQQCKEVAPGCSPQVQGDVGSDWLAVDCGNVVAHVFTEEARKHYDLEGLWGCVRHFDMHETQALVSDVQDDHQVSGRSQVGSEA